MRVPVLAVLRVSLVLKGMRKGLRLKAGKVVRGMVVWDRGWVGLKGSCRRGGRARFPFIDAGIMMFLVKVHDRSKVCHGSDVFRGA